MRQKKRLLCLAFWGASLFSILQASPSQEIAILSESCDTPDFFDLNDEQTLYKTYGFTRADFAHILKYKFNVGSIETLNGVIDKVIRVQTTDAECYVFFILKVKEETLLVNLGPIWYIDENGLLLEEGSSLRLTGSKVRINGRTLIIASEVEEEGGTVKFRDEKGRPLWEGRNPNP